MRFVFLSFKKNILPFLIIVFAIFLVVFSKTNLIAAQNGLLLWANNVVPSLFPFFVITELLSHTNVIHYIGKCFDKIMRPLFNVPGEAAFAFIIGLISGYPTGAKVVANMRENGIFTKEEGDRMLIFTNNSGPLFIISFVGVSLFGSTQTGILLLCTHILASITSGIIIAKISKNNTCNQEKYFKKSHQKSNTEMLKINNFGKILASSIENAISNILLIGGFVVLFSVIISIFTNIHLLSYASKLLQPILLSIGFDLSFAEPILAGIIELTNGVNMVASISIKAISQNVVLCAFLLGFGGISVLLQVLGMISKTDLSIKKYVIGKLLQGILAGLYTYLALRFIPMLNLDIMPTSALRSIVPYSSYPNWWTK